MRAKAASASDIDEVEISVDSWVIQDGNYGDFHVGEKLRCAFEFYGDLNPTAQRSRSATHLREDIYRVCAQIIFSQPDAWVIDFGLPVFQESQPPESVSVGAWVEGEIGLALDPFFYKDRLVNETGMPDLFNTWQIIGITRDDSPWIASPCGKIFSRDREHPCWTNVQQTDAWSDDDGRGAYSLRLRILGQNSLRSCSKN